MSMDAPGEDPPGLQRNAVYRFDQADLRLLDGEHVVLNHLVEERRQKMETRLEHSRLDADFAWKGYYTPFRQRTPEVTALDDADLLPAYVDQHSAGVDKGKR